jgi:hypothetical protein
LGWGFLGGATIGALIGVASGSEPQGSVFGGGCFMFCSAGEKAALGATTLGTAGAVVGLLAGGISRTEKWKSVPLHDVHVSVVPARNGVGFAASLSF